MAYNHKTTAAGVDIPWAILRGTAVGIILTIGGAALMSALIVREILKETSIGYSAMGILVISSYASVMVSSEAAKTKKYGVSLFSGLIYYGVLLLVNVLCFRGGIAGAGATGLMVLAGSGTAMLSQSKRGKRRRSALRKNNRR